MSDNIEDSALVNLCRQGKTGAFEKLLNKYKLPVFNLAYRIVKNPADAEDIAQNTFIKAFKNLEKYDSKYPFLTWLFKISHNLTIDFLRRTKNKLYSIDDENFPEPADKKYSLETAVELNFDKELLYSTLDEIEPLYREALLLRYKEELSYTEIANILNIPEGTVKIRLFRAKKILKNKLIKESIVK